VSEPNIAVMLCEPTMSEEVVNVAVRPIISPLPILVVPSKKLTVPLLLVGRVAVKVTGCASVEGFTDELRTTLETVAVTVFEVLGL